MSAGERERRPDREVGWAGVRTSSPLGEFGRALGFFFRILFLGTALRALDRSETIGGRISAAFTFLLRYVPLAGFLRASVRTDGTWEWPDEWIVWLVGAAWMVTLFQSFWQELTKVERDRDRARSELRSSEVLIEVASKYKVFPDASEGTKQPDGTFIYRARSYCILAHAQITNPGDAATALDCTLVLPSELTVKGEPIVTSFACFLPSSPRSRLSLIRVESRWIGPMTMEWRFAPPDGEANVEELFSSGRVRVEVRDRLRPDVAPVELQVPGTTRLPGAGSAAR